MQRRFLFLAPITSLTAFVLVAIFWTWWEQNGHQVPTSGDLSIFSLVLKFPKISRWWDAAAAAFWGYAIPYAIFLWQTGNIEVKSDLKTHWQTEICWKIALVLILIPVTVIALYAAFSSGIVVASIIELSGILLFALVSFLLHPAVWICFPEKDCRPERT